MADEIMGSSGTNFNSRVSEPQVREVATALDSLKELLSAQILAITSHTDEKAAFNRRLIEEKTEEFVRFLKESDRRYQQRFEAQERAMEAAFKAQEKLFETVAMSSKQAVDKAEAAQKDKNEMMNEFRNQLSDQAMTFMPRKEVEVMVAANRAMVETLKQDLYIQREEMLKNVSKKDDDLKKEIQGLRETDVRTVGNKEQSGEDRSSRNWAITTALAVAAFLMVIINTFLRAFAK